MIALTEAIRQRHSVRHYIRRPLSPEIIQTIQEKIDACNREGGLHIQLVVDEPKGFSGIMAYGSFSGVENYLVMAGRKSDDLDERVGYYGEQLVLLAQQLGLGTCWAGLSYRKVRHTYQLNPGEKIACMIALGFPNDEGRHTKRKSITEVSNAGPATPEWFVRGVEAALLAPTAVNQQKYYLEYLPPQGDELPRVRATRRFSIVGYTQMDLGIVKLHFEIGAAPERFVWD